MRLVLALLLTLPLASAAAREQQAPLGLAQQSEKNLEWRDLAKKRANQGDSVAQQRLCLYYSERHKYREDWSKDDWMEAATWCRKAAEDGHRESQRRLAVLYLMGYGVPQDYWEANKWLLEAAEQGDVDSQYNLAVNYYKGRGVPRDLVQAHKWFDLAATLGDMDAAKGRTMLAKEMTASEIADARRLAREWMAKHQH